MKPIKLCKKLYCSNTNNYTYANILLFEYNYSIVRIQIIIRMGAFYYLFATVDLKS